jgi:ABC-type protease/lipase transport system fused ATPase/permease subunit
MLSMSENKPPQSTNTEVVTKTLAQGSLIGVQAGCVSVLVIILALVAGLVLDRVIGTKYVFTVGLLLLSIPVSLGAMVYSVLRSTRSMNTQPAPEPTKKEDSLEKTD